MPRQVTPPCFEGGDHGAQEGVEEEGGSDGKEERRTRWEIRRVTAGERVEGGDCGQGEDGGGAGLGEGQEGYGGRGRRG